MTYYQPLSFCFVVHNSRFSDYLHLIYPNELEVKFTTDTQKSYILYFTSFYTLFVYEFHPLYQTRIIVIVLLIDVFKKYNVGRIKCRTYCTSIVRFLIISVRPLTLPTLNVLLGLIKCSIINLSRCVSLCTFLDSVIIYISSIQMDDDRSIFAAMTST
jgi:hypothetical protein